MGTQSYSIFKAALLVFSLALFAACGSTEEVVDEQQTTVGGESDAGSSAQASGVDELPPLTAEEIAMREALRTTVFYFDFDVAEFKAEDRDTLTYHARELAGNPDRRIRLEGHADERGTREYNLALGERRANGILNYLIVNGASRDQIEVVSYGEERPAENGTNETAYAANRRVEIVGR